MAATDLLSNSLSSFINIYLLLIFVRIMLSWFPTAEWANKTMATLAPITDPYLNLFRSFIPPLGNLDISPLLAIVVLQMLGSLMGGF